MAEKISLRLQTPVDDNGNRKDVHIVTSSDEVIVDQLSDESKTLTEVLKEMGTIQVQEEQPEFACIWAKPVEDDE